MSLYVFYDTGVWCNSYAITCHQRLVVLDARERSGNAVPSPQIIQRSHACNWTTKFRSQRSSHIEPSATSTTVTGPVGERLQAGTDDAPVLDRPAPLRRLHDFGAAYKYSHLLTYFLTYLLSKIND